MDVGLDHISEVLTLVDEWNAKYAAVSQAGFDSLTAADTPAQLTPTSNGEKGALAGARSGGESGSKFCIECGARIPSSAKFCPECGTKQETVSAA